MTDIVRVTIGRISLDVEFEYFPGRPGRQFMSNGDPGCPDELEETSILAVRLDGVNIIPTLSDDAYEQIEEKIADHIRDMKQEADDAITDACIESYLDVEWR